jgi:hypothetical protein
MDIAINNTFTNNSAPRYNLGRSDHFMRFLEKLYTTPDYITKLNEIKARMIQVRDVSFPQYDDIEAEIVCLILMELRPKNICEFSPCRGWSTMYMLNTLVLTNNHESKVSSYDIVDTCSSNICRFDELKKHWAFYLCNVEQKYAEFTTDIDYLFIDSDHSEQFARKYVAELLEPLLVACRSQNKQIVVSVHDVFHTPYPSEEGVVVIEFLAKNNIEYFSPINDNHKVDIQRLRSNSELNTSPIHYSHTNPAIFFFLG